MGEIGTDVGVVMAEDAPALVGTALVTEVVPGTAAALAVTVTTGTVVVVADRASGADGVVVGTEESVDGSVVATTDVGGEHATVVVRALVGAVVLSGRGVVETGGAPAHSTPTVGVPRGVCAETDW